MKKKHNLPADIEKKCHGIIHSAALAAGSVGAAGAIIPVADNALITPLQVGMIVALAKVFDRDINKEAALGVIKGAGAAIVGRAISQVLLGWIPVLGSVINSATATAITEALGWSSAESFYKEWLNDGHSVNERPKSFSTIKDDEQSKREYLKKLCSLAEAFISGEKDAKGKDNDEFKELFDKMSYEIADLEQDDSFIKVFEKMVDCLK